MERVVDRRFRPHPFALGQVIGAAVVGSATGLFLNLLAVVVFSAGLAAGAAVSAIVCRWRPGFGAAGWKLWLVGSLANPVVLAAAAFSASEYECLLGWKTGWDCLFAEIRIVRARHRMGVIRPGRLRFRIVAQADLRLQ